MNRRLITAVLVGAFALSGPLAHSSERVVVTRADLDGAVAKAVAREDAARGTITTLLQREDVRDVAGRYGLDVRRAEAAVGTLEGAELQQLSLLAADANVQLAGGDQVLRISLVAALLIVIIVILLVN